ncbi:S-adenosyl-L-methionine-dependent tRNA 4-demethylwyosine synthase [Candidatus Gugararchaeum adminiculabundum]|nr:S-adenosyl-L-methionine-dependent tRNA 4-demethylwyosine synthase [Candidatus Gugararchaeum adminiculabundum]
MPDTEKQKRLKNQGYRLIGKNAAVKLCHYTKKTIRGEYACYKNKFYGISSECCLQLAPCVGNCTHHCTFCWRSVDYSPLPPKQSETDSPDEIILSALFGQQKLISGFGGSPELIDKEVYARAKTVKHVAISLAGEPTMYPNLGELIQKFHERGISTFLVTNGMFPEVLNSLGSTNSLPTQLYISVYGPDEKTYKEITRSALKDSWQRLSSSLKILGSFKGKTRTAIRLTLVKGANMFSPEKYADLLRVANPDYVECKGYVHVGGSMANLGAENMPSHSEIKEFALQLAKEMNYSYKDEAEISRVVLLVRDPSKSTFIPGFEKNVCKKQPNPRGENLFETDL